MVSDEFLQSLPDDPEEAFGLYVNELRRAVFEGDDSERQNYNLEQTFLQQVFAYIDYHQLPFGLDREIPTNNNFWSYYNGILREIDYLAAQCSFKRVGRLRAGVTTTYCLPPAVKSEIHHYLGLIRDILANLSLSDNKRAVLARKLNAFAEEVDRDRTRIDALTSALVWTKREIIDGVKELEPLADKLEKILDKFAKATEWIGRLPSPKRSGELPAPPKRLEPPQAFTRELDDEVPF